VTSGRARLAGRLTAWSVLAASGVFVVGDALAHLGLSLRPAYLEPRGLLVVDGSEPITFTWLSEEEHPEDDYVLAYQAADLPPTGAASTRLREGEVFAVTPADALEKSVTWDLSDVPSGAWRVYAEYSEPPFCVAVEQAPALIVLRRPGEPPPLGVLVTSPFEESLKVDEYADLTLEAIGPGPLTVTAKVGGIRLDPQLPPGELCGGFVWQPFQTIAEGLVMAPDPEAGPDRWRLDLRWDTSAMPEGAYLLRVTTSEPGGQRATTYARRWINVERGRLPLSLWPPEPATPGGADTPPGTPAGALAGCASAHPALPGAPSAPWAWFVPMLVALAALTAARRRPLAPRVPKTLIHLSPVARPGRCRAYRRSENRCAERVVRLGFSERRSTRHRLALARSDK